jgi:hypothetical protein
MATDLYYLVLVEERDSDPARGNPGQIAELVIRTCRAHLLSLPRCLLPRSTLPSRSKV